VLGCLITDSIASGERVRRKRVSSVESDREKESLSLVSVERHLPTATFPRPASVRVSRLRACSSFKNTLLPSTRPLDASNGRRKPQLKGRARADHRRSCPAFLPCVNARLTRAPQTRRPCTTARSGSGVLRHSNGAHGVLSGALRANEALTAEMRRVRPARPGCAMPRYSS
jgi:hypothetical protein